MARAVIALAEKQRLVAIELLEGVDGLLLDVGGDHVARDELGVLLGHPHAQIGRDGREQRRVEIARLLRGEDQRQPVFAAFLGHGRDQLEPARPVRLVEHDGVGQPVLQAAAEHVLVDAVEHERGERALQQLVGGAVNPEDGGSLDIQRAA